MTPGGPAICEGTVLHRRTTPEVHQFTYPVSQVWLDPDQPERLTDAHPLWSSNWPAPARFRHSDYGTDARSSLGQAARDEVSGAVGRPISGPVRMLSQIRRWGWLFNPITVFLVWSEDDVAAGPIGAVLEVTNTPWKERHRYPLALHPLDRNHGGQSFVTEFDKELHVSPFLGMDYSYHLDLLDNDDCIALDIDVVDPDGRVTIHTALRTGRTEATRVALTRSLRSTPFPTHRVSAGIHAQAARLWRAGVPFVRHPDNGDDVDNGPDSDGLLPTKTPEVST